METMRSDEGALTIRMLGPADEPAVRRLAQLDSASAPDLPLLGAELAGELVAALPLANGHAVIADPFRPTADVVRMLELRVRRLRGETGRSRPILARTRAALAGSPPGAGGRLLRL